LSVALNPLRRLIHSSKRGRRIIYRAYRRTWPVARICGAVYRRMALRRTRVLAVVGSFGKTTTTRVITTALLGPSTFQPRGNYGTGLAHRLLETHPGEPYVVMEVGINGPGIMHGFAWLIAPDIAVVTGVGSEHNTSLKTLDATRREKAEMLSALQPHGLAVLNGDDPNVLWMRRRTHARAITYGFGPGNDVRAENVRLDWPRGTRFTLRVNGLSWEAYTRLIGPPMVMAVLAAVAVGHAEGRDIAPLLRNIETLEPERGRLEPVLLPNGVTLLRDDYKSALETVSAALDVLEAVPAPRRIVVLGDVAEPPGSQGDVHRAVGARVAEVADLAVFVGGGGSPYSSGARKAGMPGKAVIKAGRDYRVAVEFLQENLQSGDVVLIKGRQDQRLARVALALQGVRVGCVTRSCKMSGIQCGECPALERQPLVSAQEAG
jgi:UDP-N-acetylmuramoyl-tripeptide--D-alanyl-D-alanine ligase